jgi:hypothetical protein
LPVDSAAARTIIQQRFDLRRLGFGYRAVYVYDHVYGADQLKIRDRLRVS